MDLIRAGTFSQLESSRCFRSSHNHGNLVQAWMIETGICLAGVAVSESNPGFFHPARPESWVISTSTPHYFLRPKIEFMRNFASFGEFGRVARAQQKELGINSKLQFTYAYETFLLVVRNRRGPSRRFQRLFKSPCAESTQAAARLGDRPRSRRSRARI